MKVVELAAEAVAAAKKSSEFNDYSQMLTVDADHARCGER